MSNIVTKSEIAKLDDIIARDLLHSGAEHVLIVDMAGNLIIERGSLKVDNIMSLAVLSAANFAATAQIARLIGEEDFTLLFHKGDKRNIHFNRIGKDYIMITLFDDSVSLGLIRLKSHRVIERLVEVLGAM